MGTPKSFEEYVERVKKAKGDHILVHPGSFTTFWRSSITATCLKHNHRFTCPSEYLIVKEAAWPCDLCHHDWLIQSTRERRRKNGLKLIEKLKVYYNERLFKDYTFENSLESYFYHHGKRIAVTCKLHGDFTKLIFGFMGSSGCPECSRLNVNGAFHRKYHNQKELIDALERCTNVFDLDLSRVTYNNHHTNEKQWIGCKHGWKLTNLRILLEGGSGCLKCSMKYSHSQRKLFGSYDRKERVKLKEKDLQQVKDLVKGFF